MKYEGIDNNIIHFEPASILIVDDTLSCRKLMTAYLRKYPELKIFEAENGNNAIETMEKYNIDLVIMDMRMPVMNGFEASQEIRSNPYLKHIPIIATTGADNKDEIKRIKDICNDYLVKPISRNALLESLRKFLKTT